VCKFINKMYRWFKVWCWFCEGEIDKGDNVCRHCGARLVKNSVHSTCKALVSINRALCVVAILLLGSFYLTQQKFATIKLDRVIEILEKKLENKVDE